MSARWRYYLPQRVGTLAMSIAHPPLPGDDAPIETVGATQLDVLLRMRNTASGTLVLTHTRDAQANRERMALRRLVERELVVRTTRFAQEDAPMRNWRGREVGGIPNNPYAGIYVYALTERGRTCWLRTRERAQ